MADKNNFDEIESVLTGDMINQWQADNTSGWFKKISKGINTNTSEKKETPEGLWVKCPECKHTCMAEDLEHNLFVCPECNYHNRITSKDYFKILFDDNEYEELFGNLRSKDFLNFTDLKSYGKRLEEIWKKTDLTDSLRVGVGKINQSKVVIAAMDFSFIGGSLGSVMGEKFIRAVDYCLEHRLPYVVICKSGGARMMESAFSLMQLPKTCARLTQLSEAKLPYIALLTDPSYGGISASFGMLGDFNIAEPGAMMGFAGARVIKDTIKKELPKGFQRSEYLLEHGFLDFIVDRKELKDKLATLISLLKTNLLNS